VLEPLRQLCHVFFILPSKTFACFYVWATLNGAAVSMGLQMSLPGTDVISFEYMPRSHGNCL
jgi:hypothetical protein